MSSRRIMTDQEDPDRGKGYPSLSPILEKSLQASEVMLVGSRPVSGCYCRYRSTTSSGRASSALGSCPNSSRASRRRSRSQHWSS